MAVQLEMLAQITLTVELLVVCQQITLIVLQQLQTVVAMPTTTFSHT